MKAKFPAAPIQSHMEVANQGLSQSHKGHSHRHKDRSHRHKGRHKSRSERKVSKKYYSDSSDCSDSSISSYSSDSSVDEKLERSVDKRILSLLKFADLLGYPYEEYRPALNGITDQMGRDDVLRIMHGQYLTGRAHRFDAATRMDETRGEENENSKKKRKKKSRGTDDERRGRSKSERRIGEKNESSTKKRKKNNY